MTRMTACLAATLLATPAVAGAPWIEKEFATPGGPPLAEIEAFLNNACAPSGFDGVQTLAVQKGHEDAMRLHVYCRPDRSKARYRVTMPGAPRGQALARVKPLVADPRVRIGSFHFGENGGDDGFLLIEKVR